ncbi:MAG: diaminopimelate decarboxylase [bacterium]|jgi:diaminopimelate decarboxylase
MAAVRQLSAAYPMGSRLTEDGRLEIGGCDARELAREFGTPALVVAEDDLRARARAFIAAFRARTGDFEVHFASKAFACTAVMRVFAEEGLACDVASGGELHLALRAGFDPGRIHLHGNAKSHAELQQAHDAGVGHVVLDNDRDIERLEAIVAPGERQRVQMRIAPGVSPDTHPKISTGGPNTKFGFNLDDAPAAIARVMASDRLELEGLHMHIGSQILDLEPFRPAVERLAGLGDFRTVNLGGGLGAAYTDGDEPPSIEDYVAFKVDLVHELLGADRRILDEPGRALVANSTVTLYGVESVKTNVDTYVAVDGGMSDNLRPMLYGARYEAQVVGRPGGGTRAHLVGKHCESGDVLVRNADLADPRPGDVIVTPATGAYGFSMANTYNGVPRAPVIFARDGDARVVVRRETYDDLTARDA